MSLLRFCFITILHTTMNNLYWTRWLNIGVFYLLHNSRSWLVNIEKKTESISSRGNLMLVNSPLCLAFLSELEKSWWDASRSPTWTLKRKWIKWANNANLKKALKTISDLLQLMLLDGTKFSQAELGPVWKCIHNERRRSYKSKVIQMRFPDQ